MSSDTLYKVVDYIKSLQQPDMGIVFFGGEPLLCKDLICSAMDLFRDDEGIGATCYHFKMTTNGMILNKTFLKYAERENIQVALSIDGIGKAHDLHRKMKNGMGTFDKIKGKIELLLSFQPYAYALMVVTPETVRYYADSFQFLIENGFRYIISSLDYTGNWEEKGLKQLKKEYEKLADLYVHYTLKEKKFYFSPFEKKIASHIRESDSLCLQCHLGIRQISIAPDGKIYPCIQFVGDGISNTSFSIGNVEDGIDENMQMQLYQLSRDENDECKSCVINSRCEHRCSCLNWQTTGSINGISSFLCRSEQMLISIADKLGERLFQKEPLFLSKSTIMLYILYSQFWKII